MADDRVNVDRDVGKGGSGSILPRAGGPSDVLHDVSIERRPYPLVIEQGPCKAQTLPPGGLSNPGAAGSLRRQQLAQSPETPIPR